MPKKPKLDEKTSINSQKYPKDKSQQQSIVGYLDILWQAKYF